MSKHILLIDDDALLVKSLAFTLTQNGYRATTATSAHEGLALLDQDLPDLILLDIGLPDLDGLTVLRRIQKEHAIPVIFLTARRRELDEVLGLELGAEDYITKPYSEDANLLHISHESGILEDPALPPAEDVFSWTCSPQAAPDAETVLTIDFKGFVDGVPFEQGEATDFQLELGAGRFIPGFEEQVCGMNAGEERTISVTFPEAYGKNDAARMCGA